MAQVPNYQLMPFGTTFRGKTAPIRFTLENYENELTEARSGLLGAEQGFNTKEGEPEKQTNQTKSQKKTQWRKD